MRIVDVIETKRDGGRNSPEQLEALVLGYTRGDVPDYQVAAWLMAVVWRGMTPEETADLTLLMARSGRQLDLSGLGRPAADKHSTGGVGDKTSLVVGPLVAACGVPVAKMSGRGLGFSGGTLDKLESIPGLSVDLGVERFLEQVRRIGLVIAGQTADLAPADGKLYALRDVTGTVPSLPLIASSVMSKKLAAGAQVIALDVKAGSGAFMKTVAEATALAEAMLAIGALAGRKVTAFVTDMSQPLGRAVGNALEVREAVEALQGRGPADLVELASELAAELVFGAGAAPSRDAARAAVARALASGAAFEKLGQMVVAQSGDRRAIEDPERLPRARLVRPVTAERAGWVARADALGIARAAIALGAGREKKGDAINPAVGVVLHAKVGDRVERGDELALLHADDEARLEQAAALVAGAFELVETPPPGVPARPPLIHRRLP